MIELRELTKTYAEKDVVSDLSLTVGDGDFCVLIGPSGCGKSTTLKMINRLVPLDGGRIILNGEDVTDVKPELLRRRMGYAIQSIGLFPHWTVEQNISVVPNLLKWPVEKTAGRVADLLGLLQLDPDEFRHKYPYQLSGGQAQRVGVARALAADPDVLLMDEPFGALDPITRYALQEEIQRVHAQTRKTIVFVTHDMDEALKLADRIAIMNQGRLIQYASPLRLLTQPANDFVRDFIGKSDLGLKLLACETIGHRMVKAPRAPHHAPLDALRQEVIRHGYVWLVDDKGAPAGLLDTAPTAEDRIIAAVEDFRSEALMRRQTSLKEALSNMVWLHLDRLPVVDDHGALVGEISLQSLSGQTSVPQV